MATTSNLPEEARPPDSAEVSRKYNENGCDKNASLGDANETNKINNNNFLGGSDETIDGIVLKVSNLPANLCKSESCKEKSRKAIIPKRPFSLPISEHPNRSNEARRKEPPKNHRSERPLKNRNSFHQDVQEALNSLLWQPYEYQNKQSEDSSSVSSFSSCCSLSSVDLERGLNNGQAERCGNAVDLHLTVEMVNNLPETENRLNQYQEERASRDGLITSAASRLLACGSSSERFGCVGSSDNFISEGDEFAATVGDMRVEIAPRTTNVLTISNGLNRDGTFSVNLSEHVENGSLPQQRNRYQRSNSTEMISSLSSANVVGLPNHPRHGSMPASVPRSNLVFPNHSRNGSEPSHVRHVSTPASTDRNINCANVVSILSHQRHSTHLIDNGKNHVANLRSASVPKQKIGESGTTTLNISNHQRNTSSDFGTQRMPVNVNNVNVDFYRAVPVNVVSSVPIIECLNTNNDLGNNVSNVNIVQSMPLNTTVHPVADLQSYPAPGNHVSSTQVTVHSAPQEEVRTRTFTSTEAQTDDIAVTQVPERAVNREQRRRERRERRHQRRLNVITHQHPGNAQNERCLPDLLNNHLPPPYSPPPNTVANIVPNPIMPGAVMPNNVVPSVVGNPMVPFHPQMISGQVPIVGGPVAVPVPPPSGFRFPFPSSGFRRSRYSEEHPKNCCGLLAWRPNSLRWFIAVIALVAVCCILVGTALGAMKPAGRDHLTVSLLMIGVGIVLTTVSGVAWKLTSHDSTTCRAMLGLGSTESVDVCPRRFVPRLPPSYGRPHHPYAAMMYPEFQYRPPPPSYQASMQEYRLRLLLLDRGNTPQIQAGVQNAVSPPPTYRSHAGSLLRAPLSNRRDASQSEYSFPPSYRSQTGSTRQGPMDLQSNIILHSREQSLSLSESNHGGSILNDVNHDEDIALDNITVDSLKMAPDSDINPVKMLLKGSSSDLEGTKDGNLVTIVQTSDQNPVIVTVSGSSNTDGNNGHVTEIPTEMEILAHL